MYRLKHDFCFNVQIQDFRDFSYLFKDNLTSLLCECPSSGYSLSPQLKGRGCENVPLVRVVATVE
jgi:hypothetical protein